MKIKGAELAAFIKEGWPEPENDWYWDHDLFDDEPDANTTYDTAEIEGLFYQGSGDDPTDGFGHPLDGLIRKWRKTRTHDILIVSVPKERVDKFRAFIADIGGKIEGK